MFTKIKTHFILNMYIYWVSPSPLNLLSQCSTFERCLGTEKYNDVNVLVSSLLWSSDIRTHSQSKGKVCERRVIGWLIDWCLRVNGGNSFTRASNKLPDSITAGTKAPTWRKWINDSLKTMHRSGKPRSEGLLMYFLSCQPQPGQEEETPA